MTTPTKAVEAGARAIWPQFDAEYPPIRREMLAEAEKCITAALASGDLVPASALAAERERTLRVIEDLRISGATNFKDENCQGQRGADRADALYEAYHAVKAMPLPPAGGDYVVVPREPTEAMICAGDEKILEALNDMRANRREPTPAQECYQAMLAATNSGSGM